MLTTSESTSAMARNATGIDAHFSLSALAISSTLRHVLPRGPTVLAIKALKCYA